VLTTGLLCLTVGFLASESASAASASTPIPAAHITRLWSDLSPYLAPPKGDARIRGFGFAATVSGDECAQTVGLAPDAVSAIPGDMVCAFSISFGYAVQPWVNTEGQNVPGLSGSVTDGATHAAITADDLYTTDASEFAISVPKGSDAVLNISDAGFTQSYSLTEQKRVGISPPVLYRDATYWEVSSYPETRAVLHDVGVSDDKTATEGVSVADLHLTYFRPDDPLIRPPSPSEAFLDVGFGYSSDPGPSGDTFGNFRTLGGTAVQLRLPGGRVENSVLIDNPVSGILDADYVFVVPADFSRGSLLIRPGVVVGSETTAAGKFVRSESVAFGTATIPIGGGVATSTPPTITHAATARPAESSTKAGHGHAPAAGGAGFPLGIPIGGGSTLIILAIVIPIWRRNKHGREIVVFFPQPVMAGSGAIGVADAVDAVDAVAGDGEHARPTGEASDQTGESPPPEPPTKTRLTLRLLGDVEAEPDVGASGRLALLVLVVYLVLHAGKEVTSAELCEAFKIKPSTLANYVWRLRDQLGKDVLESKRRTAKYRYVGEIECDWASFEDLVTRARFANDDEHIELLQAALALVRGQPFGGDARYDWADEIARGMQGAVRRVAAEVSTTLWERERQGGAPEGAARRAATIGLLADPEDHSLHRLRLERSAGDIDAIDDAWADTSKRLGNRAADLRQLRRRLIGMAAFAEREEMAGS
jgi:hypothetical protein